MYSESKEQYLKLTLAVYRVVEKFPQEGEDLKEKIVESANKILADLICRGSARTGRVQEIKELFYSAKNRDLADHRNFLVLNREYARITESQKPRIRVSQKREKKRQEKILGVLKEKKTIRLSDLLQDFPQVSRRTIIRDLDELNQVGMISRNGNGRGSHYKIVT